MTELRPERVPLFTFKLPLQAYLPDKIKTMLLEATSLHHIGHKNCNVWDNVTRRYESRYHNHPNQKALEEAHWRLHATQIGGKTTVTVTVQTYSDGSFEVIDE